MTLITLKIRLSTGDTAEAKDVDTESTISELKKILHERNVAGVEPERQRLIFKGRILKEEETLETIGLQDGMTIHLVKSAKSSSTSTASPSPSPATQPTPFAAPGAGASPFGAGGWPFPAGGGAGAAGGAGAFDPFGGMGGMGLPPGMPPPTPEMLRMMMENPMVQRMMENPETIRAMIQSNPMMRAMIEQNPQLEHVLTDPQMMRQAMQAAANPAVMQELLRSQDRALANIESLPGGHNALRRMFEQDIDPMVRAAEETSERLYDQQQQQRAPAANVPANQGTGPAAPPMPNPWSTPQTAPNAPRPGAIPNPWASLGAGGQPVGGTGMPAANPWAAFGGAAPGGAAANPMAAMMQDPDFMRRMMDPANIQAMMQLQQALEQLRRGGVLPEHMFPPGFASMLPGLGSMYGQPGAPFPGMPAAVPPMAPAQPPEVRFASQLTQLESMGFGDRDRNIQALTATNGNVNAAIERLLQ